MASVEPIILEPRRITGQSCCASVTSRFDDAQAKATAELFKALADPTRLQILDILVQHTGKVCVCDFEGVVGQPDPQTGQRPKQPTISHHLRVLREAGLVGYEKQGVWAYYYVQRERLAEIGALMDLLR